MWSRKGVDLDGKGDEEEFGGVEGEETISGCIMWEKNLFLIKYKKSQHVYKAKSFNFGTHAGFLFSNE